MMPLKFQQIDAFTDRPFTGNPAAVMVLDAWLDDATLQAIAMEHNLSETAFLVRRADDNADYDLRWFTPTVEVAMCGHATLASGHALLSADPALARMRFATRKSGILSVERDGDRLALSLPAMTPVPADVPGLAQALGATPAEVLIRMATTIWWRCSTRPGPCAG